MHEERNGRPGRRYDDMTQQNQSPVVTDEELEAMVRAHDREDAAQKGEPDPWHDDFPEPFKGERLAAMRCAVEALTQPSGKVSDEMVERAMKSWFKDDYQNGMVMGVAATLDIHGEMRAALEAAQLPAPPVVNGLTDSRTSNPASGELMEAPQPAPDELEVAAWLVVINEKFNSLHWTESEAANCITHFNNGSKQPLVRLTDAHAAIAAKDEEIERLIQERNEARSIHDIDQRAFLSVFHRAERAEARVSELEKALTPFAFLADCSEREPVGASVMVNVERCRDARAALNPEREG